MKLIKLPYTDGSDKNKDCELAPDKIVEALDEIWLNEDFKNVKFSVESSDINKIKEGDVYLGGDHSISYHIIKSLNKKNMCLLVFDAHPDVFQEFDKPTHADWLKHLIDEKVIKKENVILIGIRNPDKLEIKFLMENNIKFYTTKQIFMNIENVCDSVMEFVRKFDFLYISVDIDVLDPAFAFGVSFPEPGGLNTRELLYFLQRIKLIKNEKNIDVVEVNPIKDINNITSKTAAKIIGEFA